METETPEEISEFRHCVLARTQQNNKTNRTTRRTFEYTNDKYAYTGVKTNKYQAKRTMIQDGRTDEGTNDPAERNEEPPD